MSSSPTGLRINIDTLTRQCESQKVCYADRDLALEAAEGVMEKGRIDPGFHIMTYACDRCGYWHLYNQRIVDKATVLRIQQEVVADRIRQRRIQSRQYRRS